MSFIKSAWRSHFVLRPPFLIRKKFWIYFGKHLWKKQVLTDTTRMQVDEAMVTVELLLIFFAFGIFGGVLLFISISLYYY